MPRLSLPALALLAACAAPVAAPVAGYRDPAAPIYSSAVLDPAQIAGTWRQVADFAAGPVACAGGVTIAAGRAAGQLCVGGLPVAASGPLQPVGPGRFAAPGGGDPWWVLWADADRRTLVIGTPSGRFGFVLNRGGALPPDRLTAAREILAFNGYDLSRLRMLP